MDTGTTIEATVSSAATKGMGGGAGTMLLGVAVSNEVIALVGLSITFLGFVVNLVFKLREDRRKQELHELSVASMRHRE